MQEFNYHRASRALAHGLLFTKASACKAHDLPSGTYDRWKNRANSDEKLKQLVDIQLQKLVKSWDEDVINSVKKGLKVVNLAFENNPFDAKPDSEADRKNWGYNVNFLSQAIKNVGEIGLADRVLSTEEGEEEEDIE